MFEAKTVEIFTVKQFIANRFIQYLKQLLYQRLGFVNKLMVKRS